jgi:hypothetical protein
MFFMAQVVIFKIFEPALDRAQAFEDILTIAKAYRKALSETVEPRERWAEMSETSAALRFEFSRRTGTLTVSPQDPIAELFHAAIEDNQLTGAWCYLVVGVKGVARVVDAFVSPVGGGCCSLRRTPS